MKSVYSLLPISDLSKDWVKANVNYESWQILGGTIVIEHGYIIPIVEGMIAEGFVQGQDFEVF